MSSATETETHHLGFVPIPQNSHKLKQGKTTMHCGRWPCMGHHQ